MLPDPNKIKLEDIDMEVPEEEESVKKEDKKDEKKDEKKDIKEEKKVKENGSSDDKKEWMNI